MTRRQGFGLFFSPVSAPAAEELIDRTFGTGSGVFDDVVGPGQTLFAPGLSVKNAFGLLGVDTVTGVIQPLADIIESFSMTRFPLIIAPGENQVLSEPALPVVLGELFEGIAHDRTPAERVTRSGRQRISGRGPPVRQIKSGHGLQLADLWLEAFADLVDDRRAAVRARQGAGQRAVEQTAGR